MRNLRVPLLLALFALAARAQEGATAQLPKGSPVAVRIASLDRVDALVKDALPMLKALGLGDDVAELEQMPASNWIFVKSGLSPDLVDRTKPIYLGLVDEDEPIVVLHPAAGATWEGKKELREDGFAVLRGGAVVVGKAGRIDAEPRGTPTTFRVEGDVVLHVYLADLIAEHKDEIEQNATEAAMGVAAAGAVPEQARALILPVVTAFKDGVLSLEAFDYGVTWTGERLESEGFVTIREGSGLRTLLKRAGEPGATDLVRYLPADAFMTITTCMNPDWPVKEMRELLEKAGGGAVANAVLQILSFGSGFSDHLTGRGATAVSMQMMAGSSVALFELKPGTDTAKLFDSFDPAKANEALKSIGIPIGYTFKKGAAKHGETDLHEFTMTSDNPMLAMSFAGMPGCMAARDGILFVAMAPMAQGDVAALLDKVQRGEKAADHPHAAAMARLGRGCNVGFTLNLGALKPMMLMFGGMMPPEARQIVQNIPANLPFSTAITFPDGNIRWRGDWPVKEVVKIAEAIVNAMPAPPPPEKEGEFD
jgi:hypothetical protein